jgi:ABC-type lipoprotein export system ATPase subunit
VTALASLRGVAKRYDDVTFALGGVDLDIDAGEFVALVGRSGSGKSTLLNILGLLDRPSEGDYRLAGHRVTEIGAAQHCWLRAHYLGFVFQSFHLLGTRTAAHNVELGALYLGWTAARRRARARELLDRLGLADKHQTLPQHLSGGERQRVAIARALMGDPALLLCDEPTGNLDSDNADTVLDVLSALNGAGTSIVLVTHDAECALRADRVVRLGDGQIA